MLLFIHYFQEVQKPTLQPFIFYIDARWSSLLLLDELCKARFYGVLSCSASMKPKGLMNWMRSGLELKDWWSVGYTPNSANLVTIRTKKKVYLNLLTNWADLSTQTVIQRKRKHPEGTYTIKACAVQKEYNLHKSKVDQWNKALLTYYRHGQFTSIEASYTRFFIHAWTLQAWTLYKASKEPDIRQLDFRKSLLQQLAAVIFPPVLKAPLVRLPIHWPTPRSPAKGKCAVNNCRSSCTHYCYLCEMWGCILCLTNYHLELLSK